MKKLILMTMLLVSVVAKADWEVILAGEDKESEKNLSYPNVMALYDYTDKKYDIYRSTRDHGYGFGKGDVLDKETLNFKSGKFKYNIPLVYKGKKCINLTKKEMMAVAVFSPSLFGVRLSSPFR